MWHRLVTHQKVKAVIKKPAVKEHLPVFFCAPKVSSLSTTCNTEVLKANTPNRYSRAAVATSFSFSVKCLTFVAADKRPAVLIRRAYQ